MGRVDWKLDFKKIREQTEGFNSMDEIVAYENELYKKFPNMTEKQRNVLNGILKDAKFGVTFCKPKK